MVYLVFDEITETPQKTKEESIVNSKTHSNTEIKEKTLMVERPEDAAKVIQDFEEIIRSNKKNIVWLAYQ